MGKSQSKPVVIDPLFRILTCPAFLRSEYDKPRLEMAPFLYYKFHVSTYDEYVNTLLTLLRNLPLYDDLDPSKPPTSPEPLPEAKKDQTFAYETTGYPDLTRRIFGPVYSFVAWDPERKNIEAYLFLPSMTKKGMPWPNYYFLGMCHNWMWRILYGPTYNLKAYGACKMRPNGYPMEFGCRTETSLSCVQSKKTHRRMGIFRRKKNRASYPAAYFRAYEINLRDARISGYVNNNSLYKLQRNILPGGIDMFTGCRYMLISPNQRFFYILGRSRLTVFQNLGTEDVANLCLRNRNPRQVIALRSLFFMGGKKTRLLLEDDSINIYADDENGVENIVLSLPAAMEAAKPPFALVLTDDGRMVVYDSANKAVSSNMFDDEFQDEYDPVLDRKMRLLNMVAYLRLLGLYKETPVDVVNKIREENPDLLPLFDESIPPFNSNYDYTIRLQTLVMHLQERGYLRRDDSLYYLLTATIPEPEEDLELPPAKQSMGLLPPPPGSGGSIRDKIKGLASSSSQPADQTAAGGGEEEEVDPTENMTDDERIAYYEKLDKEIDDAEKKQEEDLQKLEDDGDLGAAMDAFRKNAPRTSSTTAAPTAGVVMTPAPPICPVPRGAEYSKRDDMYCRMQALRKLWGETTFEQQMASELAMPPQINIDDYDRGKDRTNRLRAWEV
jgi:hypothetical protein